MRWAALALLVSAAPAWACVLPWGDHVPGSLVFSETTSPFTTVWYADASDSYGHGIMGDVLDGKTLGAQTRRMASLCFAATVSAGANHVFEDIAPRLTDVDGDGRADIVAVRSSFAKGAQLVVYTLRGDALEILAATPYIGQRHRWLAPAAIGDLDGDGHVEIAYVDRPHLAKTLRIWRYANGDFREVASAGGLTNHAIGDEVIHGGLRDCGQGPEIVLSNADRTRMLAVTYDGADIAARDIGPFSPAAAVRAVACQ